MDYLAVLSSSPPAIKRKEWLGEFVGNLDQPSKAPSGFSFLSNYLLILLL
jgi:hypothetical protein